MQKVFKGKAIAFVGLAPNIQGKGLGAEIDAHDLVYRTNVFPVPGPEDYGSRCDIISVIPDHIERMPLDVKTLITFEPHPLSKYVVTEIERLKIRGWFMYHHELDIFDATAGMVALWLAKKWKAKSIKFYGVTGYQDKSGNVVNHSKDWTHYTEWAYDISGGRDRAFSADMPNYDCHNFWNINTIFRRLLAEGEIEMDQFSKEYFQYGRM